MTVFIDVDREAATILGLALLALAFALVMPGQFAGALDIVSSGIQATFEAVLP